MKKIVILLLSCIILHLFCLHTVLADGIAKITFSGPNPECINSAVLSSQATDEAIFSSGGITGWVLNPKNEFSHIVVDIDDTYMYSLSQGKTVDVTITYFDTEKGAFALLYDATDNYQYWAGSVEMNGSKQWVSKTFHLDRPYFGNRLHRGDVQLVTSNELLSNQETIIISEIEIKNSAHLNPVEISISSKNTGNIFWNDDIVKFDVSYKNVADMEQNFNVRVYATDENGTVIYDITKSLELSGNQSVCNEIIITERRFGVFKLFVEVIDGQNEEVYSKCDALYSRVNTDYGKNLNKNFGYSVHLTQPGYEREKSAVLLANSGAGVLRDSFGWSEYEGQVDCFIFRDLWRDMIIDAKENHQEYMLILGSDNRWRYPNQYDDIYLATDQSRKQFQKYVTRLVTELGDSVKYYEVWNEYNIKNPDVAAYYNLLKITYETIKAVKPDAIVIGGALANQYSEEEGKYTVPYDYIKELFDMGAGNYMDVLSIHPYTVPLSPENGGLKKTLDKTKELVHGYNDTIDVWASEFGWYTKDGVTTEAEQAEYAVRTLIANQAYGFMDKFFWYTFQDESANLYDSEHCWGMIRSVEDAYGAQKYPYAAKSSYVAIANANKILAGAKFLEDLSDEVIGRYVYRFVDRYGREFYAMWNTETNDNYCLNSDKTAMQLVDMYGNEKKVYAQNGKYNIQLSSRPIYLYEAVEGISYEPGGAIRITGYVPTEKENVNVGITVLYSDRKSASIDGNLNDVLYVNQKKSQKNGRYSFDIELQLQNGTYTAIIATDDSDLVYTYEFELCDKIVVEYNENIQENVLITNIIINNIGKESYKDLHLFLALYNGDKLEKCEQIETSISTTDMVKEYSFNVVLDQKYTHAYALLWDKMMKPLSIRYEVASLHQNNFLLKET